VRACIERREFGVTDSDPNIELHPEILGESLETRLLLWR
jgi:hypothetical protein